MFKEGWIVVNEVPTHVQTWGGWIEDKITSDSIVVCITGNPGVTSFYSVFLESIHNETGLPVWVINHTGLEMPPGSVNMSMPPLKSNPNLYNLEGQILHKLSFIQRYCGQDVQLYLIGHSAGAKMVTGVLKEKSLIPRTKQAYFLFPTLENIAQSRFGKLHVQYGKYFRRFIIPLVWLVSCLPMVVKRWVVKTYIRHARKAEPVESITQAALQLLNPDIVKAALFLARDEMINIKDLDLDVLLGLGDRVHCYYGQKDGWSPLWQADNMKVQCPQASVTILEPKYKHAFVLSTPREIASMISKHIKETSDKQL